MFSHIDDIVDFANHDAEWRRGYMTFVQAQMDAMNEGKDIQAKSTALKMHAAGMANAVIAEMVGYDEAVVAKWISDVQA